MEILIWIIGGLLVVVILAVAAFYAALGMAKYDFFWTKVEEGWYKVVMHFGQYRKTLGPGLHWLGLPGVDMVYSRKMEFKKCVIKNGGGITVKDHDDPNITSFKSTTYPYAIPFENVEDSHGLPLTGVVATHARMTDPFKAFFKASDWYLTMVNLTIPALRQALTEVSWEEITGQNVQKGTVVKKFGQLLWESMNAPREGGKPSVVSELRDAYGIEVESVELASIDPPPGWRDTTLDPYKSQKKKEAAAHEAEASAILFDDTNIALQKWISGQMAAGHNPTQAQIDAKQAELRERALAKTPGYQQIQVKGLENATTAVVGGGPGAGVFVGGGQQGGRRKNRGGNDREKGGSEVPPEKMSDDELDEWAERQRKNKEGE